jgi:signal transduction histidine kinase
MESCDLEDLSEQEIKMMNKSIYDSGKRLLRLVSNFTFYTRLLESTISQDFSGYEKTENIESLIHSETKVLADFYKRHQDINLVIKASDPDLPKEHFVKTVHELTDNAFKFSEPGSPVDLEAIEENDMFCLCVVNRGNRLDASYLDQIKPFTQFDRKTYEQQGAGLGLAIVKKVAELNGGGLIIENPNGNTNRIKVRLPLRSDGN